MEVTQAVVERIKAKGGCRVPSVGTAIEEINFADLVWAEDNQIIDELPALGCESVGVVPLWARCRSGSGSGYGDGYGDGYGES